MNNKDITLKQLAKKLDNFDKERNWLDLDSSDIAKSIVIESAELLEHFQWDVTTKKRERKILKKDKQELAFEAADILIFLLKFCRVEKIDLAKATLQKLKKVIKKYPVNLVKNSDFKTYKKIKMQHRKK